MNTTTTQTTAATQIAPIAAALRDVAFVLQMTRKVKAAIRADQPQPKSAARPAGRAEHLVGV